MRVQNLMVALKFSILLVICNTALANDTIPLSTTNGVYKEHSGAPNSIGTFVKLYKFFQGNLNREDRETHTMTVLHAMDNLENGEVAMWHNDREKTAGRVRVVVSYPVQGGVCRKFFTQVQINGEIRDYSEEGCRTMSTPYWIFSR